MIEASISIGDAFSVDYPRVVMNPDTQQLITLKPEWLLLDSPDTETQNMRNRYHMIRHHLTRSTSTKHIFVEKTSDSESQYSTEKIKPESTLSLIDPSEGDTFPISTVEGLPGSDGIRFVFGLIISPEAEVLFLEDLHQSIRLDLKNCRLVPGEIITKKTFVLVKGKMNSEGDMFEAYEIVLPPPISRSDCDLSHFSAIPPSKEISISIDIEEKDIMIVLFGSLHSVERIKEVIYGFDACSRQNPILYIFADMKVSSSNHKSSIASSSGDGVESYTGSHSQEDKYDSFVPSSVSNAYTTNRSVPAYSIQYSENGENGGSGISASQISELADLIKRSRAHFLFLPIYERSNLMFPQYPSFGFPEKGTKCSYETSSTSCNSNTRSFDKTGYGGSFPDSAFQSMTNVQCVSNPVRITIDALDRKIGVKKRRELVVTNLLDLRSRLNIINVSKKRHTGTDGQNVIRYISSQVSVFPIEGSTIPCMDHTLSFYPPPHSMFFVDGSSDPSTSHFGCFPTDNLYVNLGSCHRVSMENSFEFVVYKPFMEGAECIEMSCI